MQIKDMEIINLKEREDLLDQYIQLRNAYCELLLTLPVTLPETTAWLKRDEIEIRGLVDQDVLIGVVILYLSRNGEVAFFVKEPNQGIGSQLLTIAKEIAKQRNLTSIWAWVLHDNFIAQRTFKKNGFVKKGISEKIYQGSIKQGIEYQLSAY
jgi:RimJ/RimL family protein N-acetyltransferase